VFAAIVGVVALGAVVWRASVDFIPLTLTADTRIAELRLLSVGDLVGADSAPLADLRVEVDLFKQEVAPAVRDMGWLANLAPALAWLPAVDHEVAAWAMQADRLRGDLETASTLLASSSKLLDEYDRAQANLLRPITDPSLSPRSSEVLALEASFASAEEELTEAAHMGRTYLPVFRFDRVRRAMDVLEKVEERMLAASVVGRLASGLLVELLEIGDRARPLVGQFSGDSNGTHTLTGQELKTTVAELNDRLQFALVKSSEVARTIASSEQSDSLLGRMEFLDEVLNALLIVNKAALVALQALGPALQGSEAATGSLLSGDGSLVALLNGVAARKEQIGESLALLDDARRILANSNLVHDGSQRIVGTEDLAAVVDRLQGGLRMLSDIAPVGAELVGADSTRRYLVLGQSADELRATGGFVSSIWLVTFDNGVLVDVRYHDSVLVDDWERLALYPPAPPGLAEHMNARVWLLRDVSWEPDFPTTARTAADMFKLGQGQDVDGVIALNQWTLLALIQSLGSIQSPGGDASITPRNLFSKLEEGSDEHGRAYMDLVLQGILDRLDESISLPTLMSTASAVYSSLHKRDLLLYLEDPKVHEVVRNNGWDGRVRQDSSDYLYVVDSNVGWSKADRNIERKLSYRIDLRKASGPRISLTLEYQNHGGPGSPGCEPQWRNRGTSYGQLKNSCYWNYWRVYVPREARLLSATQLPLPSYSVSAEIGRGRAGDDTVRVSSSYNKLVLSGLFALDAGETNQVSLVYDLPSDVLRREGEDIAYQLLLQKQPGTRGRDVTVELILPAGYRLASSSIKPVSSGDSRVEFFLRTEQDTELAVGFTRSDNGSR
jgi:hypothetical protein